MAEPIPKCHVVAIPYPGRGHINPMLSFCKTLLTHEPHDVLISFIVTEEWLAIMTTAGGSLDPPLPRNLTFHTIPNNVIPSEVGRANDFKGFYESVQTKMQGPVEEVLDRLPGATAIVYDTALIWAVEAGIRRGVRLASFWTEAALLFSVFHHWEILLQNGRLSVSQDEIITSNIPGIPSMNLADLPLLNGKGEELLPLILEAVERAQKTQYLLFTTTYELEARVIDHLKRILSPAIFSVGLAITRQNSAKKPKPGYIEWLDAQPEGSVLYVSQGSFLTASTAQLEEIVSGICSSGVRFLWVWRGDLVDDRMVRAIDGGRGFVVRWCDQPRVLAHASVGGFWSHCGWNSTKEGAFFGVPMLTFPLLWDQPTNSKVVADVWRTGLRVGGGGGGTVVDRDEIAALVRRIMDRGSEEGEERRRRVEGVEGICKRDACGSSEGDVLAFLRDLMGEE